jgi:serine/threonine protein kinase
MTMHDLYDVDESDGALIFGEGRYAKVRPATRKNRPRSMSFSGSRLQATTSHESLWNVASNDGVGGCNKSSNDLKSAMVEYQCALKIIDKKEFWTRVKKGRERADTLVRETAVQTTLAVLGAETSGFLRLLNIFETGEHLVLELELLNGTDLFQHISSRGVLDEVEAAHITRDLLNCLTVLDKIGIAHRDIKPANLLMCHEENNNGSKIKLADYGMASFVGVDNLVRGRCGTPGFVAPEILLTHVDGGYGNKVDVFSAGVTLYVMLAGYEPFYGESDEELIKANREAKVDFPHADWHTGKIAIGISPCATSLSQASPWMFQLLILHGFHTINLVSVEGRDLLEKMLTVDPSKRIGPSEALRHPWITRRVPSRSNEDFCNQPLCSIF